MRFGQVLKYETHTLRPDERAFLVREEVVRLGKTWGNGIRSQKGFILIEVMVVVAIVGFLAAITISAYTDYVTRSRRSDAFTALETVRAAQEMYRAENGLYAGGLGSLAGCGSGMAGDNYTISVTRTSNTEYTATADSQNRQADDFDFRSDQDGIQEHSADGGSNWHDDVTWEELRKGHKCPT